MPEPPRWTIGRTTAILATSLLVVVVAGVPALAQATIEPTDVVADTNEVLTLSVTEPTDEDAADYGETARVVVRAPSGFTVSCESGFTWRWSCAGSEDGTRLTFNRRAALRAPYELTFTAHTAKVNGTYEFRVTQADGPPAEEGEDPPTTIPSRAAVMVTGGTDPSPAPTQAPGSDSDPDGGDGNGSTTGDGSDSGDGSGSTTGDGSDSGDGTTSSQDPSDATSSESGSGTDGADADTTDDDGGSTGGSTAPRRTQGRASGTTLEIMPGEPTGDDPVIAPPAVAGDAATAPPGGAERDRSDTSDPTATAAAGTQPSDQPGGGAPWQQWVGAAMLLAGFVTVGVRWFRERRAG